MTSHKRRCVAVVIASAVLGTPASVSSLEREVETRIQVAIAESSAKVDLELFEDAVTILRPLWSDSMQQGWFEGEVTGSEARLWENFLFVRSDYYWRYGFDQPESEARIEILERAAAAHGDYFEFVTRDEPANRGMIEDAFYKGRARDRLRNYAATLFQARMPSAALHLLEEMAVSKKNWFYAETIDAWIYALRARPGDNELAPHQEVRQRLVQEASYRSHWRKFLDFFEEWSGRRSWRRVARARERRFKQILGDKISMIQGGS